MIVLSFAQASMPRKVWPKRRDLCCPARLCERQDTHSGPLDAAAFFFEGSLARNRPHSFAEAAAWSREQRLVRVVDRPCEAIDHVSDDHAGRLVLDEHRSARRHTGHPLDGSRRGASQPAGACRLLDHQSYGRRGLLVDLRRSPALLLRQANPRMEAGSSRLRQSSAKFR